MAKIKLRYRNEIMDALAKAHGPVSLKVILRSILTRNDPRNPGIERAVAKELRFLIKMKEVEKGAGSLYRIRPAKNARAKVRREHDQPFEDRDQQEDNRNLKRPGGPATADNRGGLIRGKVIKNNRGFAFVSPINPPPFLNKEDVFLNPEEAAELLTGDIVDITLDRNRHEKGFSGRLQRIVERGLQKTVARYIKGTGFAPPIAEVDTKDIQLQIELDKDPTFKDTVDGAAILVEVTHSPRGGERARGKILSVIADSMNSTTDDPMIMVKHKLSTEFSDAVLAEAQCVPDTIQKTDFKGREDLREMAFVTIDGADSRDFDDAVFARRLPNGMTRLLVAVADVAHYVRPGTAIDKEAYERGTSVYFPHRVLPMLPERLSNGICSLNPNEDRLVLVAEIEYDPLARKTRHRVFEAVFRSHHRCVYETLQQYYDRPNDNGHEYSPRVRESLDVLFDLYKKSHQNRIRRGAIDLNLPEAKVKVNRETGEVDAIVRTERKDTHRLIEEFMIAANEAVSEIMEEHKQAFIFRVHEAPEQEAAQRFLDTAKALHLKVNENWLKDEITPQTYQKILRAIEESPAARVLNFLLLRSMKQAFYSAENLYHFGLASRAYSHFTSPIRRYPDLIVHRLLKAFIHKSKKEQQQAKGSVAENLDESAAWCSMRERVAVDAEREFVRIKQVRYAEKHLGEEHTGTVIGINPKGAYVELVDAFIEGFVPLERFGPDFVFNEKLYHLRGKRSGKIIQIGDQLNVQIARTNPHLLQIELEPLAGRPKRPVPTPERPGTVKLPPKEARDFWTPEDFE
ncbi:MAG: ribonuclease R [Bdellovibrionota bacterium]